MKWPLRRIGDVSQYVTVGYVGPQASLFAQSGVPLLRGQNIRPYSLDLTNLKYVPAEVHARWHKSALAAGDVVIVRVGYPGTACVIPDGLGDLNAASLVIVRPKASDCDPNYLTFALNSNWGRQTIASLLVGSAQQVLNTGTVSAMAVPLPPPPTQRKIVAILGAYNDFIEGNNRRVKVLEEMAQRIYQEWFVDFRYPGHENVPFVDCELGSIPQGWSIRSLFDVAEVLFGFPFKSALFNADQGVPVIRIRDIPNGESATLTTESPAPTYKVGDGDILVGMDGDFHMGRWSAGEAWLNQRVARFRVISEVMCRYGLYLSLQKPIADWNRAIVGTTVAHLGKRHLEMVKVVTPPAYLATRVAALLDPIFDQEIKLRKASRLLRATRDLLLPRLISGEVDVTDLNIRGADAAA